MQRVPFNLHRKPVPLEVLKTKAQGYVDANLIAADMAERCIRVIECERGDATYINDLPGEAPVDRSSNLSTRLSPEQLVVLLARREEMMKDGEDGVTDQWRVYKYIIDSLESGRFIRLMVAGA